MALTGEMPESEAHRRSPALGGVSECAGRNDEMNVRSRPRKQIGSERRALIILAKAAGQIPRLTKLLGAALVKLAQGGVEPQRQLRILRL